MHWHKLHITNVYEILDSSTQGLSNEEAQLRLTRYGINQIQKEKNKTISSILLSQFRDIMILILLVAAIVAALIGDITDALVIMALVLLDAMIGFIQEYKAEKAIQLLKQMTVTQTTVLRSNMLISCASTELVPGDIILLEAGNMIPADCRIIESRNLSVEEAALTGEAFPVEKNNLSLDAKDLSIGDKKNMLFKGTYVNAGKGSAIVVATGMQTELGNIAKLLEEKLSPTPLQQRVKMLGKRISILVLLLCTIFFITGLLHGDETISLALTSISLAVAAIPEALPAVITITLAMSARRMIKLNTLIRKLSAIETLGAVTYICADKTGTLTQNKMQVEKVFVNDRWYSRNDLFSFTKDLNIQLLLQAFALNNDALYGDNNRFKGDSSELALLEMLHAHHSPALDRSRLAEIPFDAERKLMSTFHHLNNSFISFTKGAPDMLLHHCHNPKFSYLQDQINTAAAEGYRILGFAYKKWASLPEVPNNPEHENDLIFLGLAALIDQPREEVFKAVQACKNAGIVPVMITGDHPITARVIAQRIGIFNVAQDKILTGQELQKLDDNTFLSTVESIRVYARVSPEQKMKIIKALQNKGHCVAMTGDGINDAPSLKKANIGIAMGITGTDVAKDAAHMILLDDNFSTIITTIREGRRVYDNILKFIKFLMTANSGELLTLLIGPMIGLPIALLPINILWINLVSDGLPALSLSFEKEEKDIMQRPPRALKESVFAKGGVFHLIWVGVLMSGIALVTQAYALHKGWHWQTILFNVLCLGQLGHVMAIRSEKESVFKLGLFSNPVMLAAILITIILQISVTYIPLLQIIFKTQTLSVKEMLLTIGASSLVFIAVEFEKLIIRKKQTLIS
ncbi:MAG: cation-translocating P-type ATPase [Bacteroidota bacterium]|nr:cation-translocating P-type ATPase [Bacteroidota bacterium]